MAYLGLDLSTSVVGFCVLTDEGTYVNAGYIDLKKYKNLYEKLDVIVGFLSIEENPWLANATIFIEEPALGFSKTTAYTLGILQRWNGMISGLVYSVFGSPPILINVSHARKLCGVKIPKKKKGEKKKVKEVAFEHVKSLNIIPESKWEYKKKSGKIKDQCMDMTDAVIVALGGYKELNGQK